MSLPQGRPKEGSLPLGGKARGAKGAHICLPQGRPKEGSLPASLGQQEKPSLGASAGATIRLGVDPRAKNTRGAPRRVANIAVAAKARSAKGAPIGRQWLAVSRRLRHPPGA